MTAHYVVMRRSSEIDMTSGALPELSNLRVLEIINCELKQLPAGLAKLSMLQKLSLSMNHIEEVTKELGEITELISLDLSHNNIKSWPPALTRLKRIQELNLAENPLCKLDVVTTCQNYFGFFSALETFKFLDETDNIGDKILMSYLSGKDTVDLSNMDCGFNSFPPFTFGILGKHLRVMRIKGTPLESILPEVMVDNAQRILHYIAELRQEKVVWNQVKVIVCGFENVGKTTLIKCLTNPKAKKKELRQNIATNGIQISQFSGQGPNNEKVMFNVWDFGGQEMYGTSA